MSLLITNGRVITASDDYVADVYCDNGTITAIGKDLPSHRYQAGRTITPAWVTSQVLPATNGRSYPILP